MVTVALFVRLEAKPGREADVEKWQASLFAGRVCCSGTAVDAR
jgi:hypothetical protein